MPINAAGYWEPDLSPKQALTLLKCHPDNPDKKKFFCLSGPRRSGKSVGALHALAQHLWNTSNAQACILCPSISAASDSGLWTTLVDTVLPEWFNEGNFGFAYLKEPFVSGATKKLRLETTNRHGTKSTLMLESIREPGDRGLAELEKKVKGRMFDFVLWSEVGSWVHSRRAFDVLIETLRHPGLPAKEHTLLLDTNPADTGKAHWIYELFYDLRTAEDIDPALEGLRKQLDLLEIMVDDNPYLTEEDRDLLKAQYLHSEDLAARYLRGEWVTANTNAVFGDTFREKLHVIPTPGPQEEDPEVLVPEPGCAQLFTAWDPGQVNHGVVLFERAYKESDDGKELPVIKVLDEVELIQSDLLLDEVTEMVLEKMAYWSGMMDDDVIWTHISDTSALNFKSSMTGLYQAQVIYEASNGQIALQPAQKKSGSVSQQLDLVRKLLFNDRLYVSGMHCPRLIEAMKALPRGKNRAPVDRNSRYKHIVDALRYGVSFVCYDEVSRNIYEQIRERKRASGGSGLVQVAF